MRSISTDQRSPSARSMPGRYKSCRRSTSELFTKEQEQELQRCAPSEDIMKVEQKGTEQQGKEQQGKNQESPVKMAEVSPPKLTPLRWRSTSMKNMDGSVDAGSSAPAAKESIQAELGSVQPTEGVKHFRSTKRPSQAQLRAQVMNSLSLERTSNVQPVERVNQAEAPEPVYLADGNERTSNVQPVERVNQAEALEHGILADTNEPTSNVQPVERVNQAEGLEHLYLADGNEHVPVKEGSLSLAKSVVDVFVKEEPLNTAKSEVDVLVNEGSLNSAKSAVDVLVNEGSLNSTKSEEQVSVKEVSREPANSLGRANAAGRRELFPENLTNQKEEIVNSARLQEGATAPEIRDIKDISGFGKKLGKPVSVNAEVMEEVVFQPVDLDKKYREKELVRHYTAAKIQNREEALLNNPSSPGLNNSRKVPVGEEPAAMTIEFLRARLQAERSASKATKLRMEHLSKKVVDLEGRLLTEVELRKSAETSLQDALLKLKKSVPQTDDGIPQAGPRLPMGTQKVSDTRVMKESEKTVSRVDKETTPELTESKLSVNMEKDLIGQVELSEPEVPVKEEKDNVGKVQLSKSKHSAKEEKDLVGQEECFSRTGEGKEQSSTSQKASESIAVNEGGLWRERSVLPQKSGQDTLKGAASMNGGSDSLVKQESGTESSPERTLTPSMQRQETRAAIEERLRSMWAKIGEEMAALAEVQGEEGFVKKDAKGLMGHQTTTLQRKSSGDPGASNIHRVDSSEVHQSTSNQQTEERHANRNIQLDEVVNRATSAVEKRSSFKRNVSLAKNVAKLVEQFEIQETAQREWEENFEAQQSLEQNEGELPALVTRDGDVVSESESGAKVKGGIARSQSAGEQNLNDHGGHISRSKSLGVLPSSQQGVTRGGISRKGRSQGRIEILEDNAIESGDDDEELLYDPETEVAEELPNGIYLHHSRAEVDPYKRGVKDGMYRKGTERVVGSSDINSPSRSDKAAHNRDRFRGEVDQQGWPVREVQDRASRDMYYEPIINSRGVRVDAPYRTSDREFQHKSKSMADDMYRNGHRWDAPGMDRAQRQDERRVPATQYSEEAPGMPYGYHDRDLEQDVPYRTGAFRHREDGHRGMPDWQDVGDPGFRNRGMSHNSPYGYPPPYGMEEPQQAQYAQPGVYAEAGGYSSRRDTYMAHGAHHSRPDYYPGGGIPPGPRQPMNGYVPPDRPPASQGYAGWENHDAHEECNAPVGVSEDIPQAGEAGEVLKALRIAKQQIKSSTVDQAAFMTAQYTVSQEHRYGAGGQVSKTSYTVEAPVGYPRVTKTVHEGWHLEGGKSSLKKRGGFNGTNVTDLINGTGPLTVNNAESSYVEKLNVGRGIQFFFSS